MTVSGAASSVISCTTDTVFAYLRIGLRFLVVYNFNFFFFMFLSDGQDLNSN